MATYTKNSLGLATLGLALTLLACGGDGGEAKPPKQDASFTDDKDGGDDEDGSTSEDDAGEGGASSDGGVAEDPLNASAAEAEAKGWVAGCYKQPKTNKELLNSCAKGSRKFDKKLYPASWKEGEALPALP